MTDNSSFGAVGQEPAMGTGRAAVQGASADSTITAETSALRQSTASPERTVPGIYLVCGSRDWPAPWFVTAKMIALIPRGSLVITGGARGVDEHAHREAVRLGYETKVMPAEWEKHGKRAGFLRNLAMLDELGPGQDAVLAFCNRFSRGTMHTIREAMKREICLWWFKDEDLRPDIAALDTGHEPISGFGQPSLWGRSGGWRRSEP